MGSRGKTRPITRDTERHLLVGIRKRAFLDKILHAI